MIPLRFERNYFKNNDRRLFTIESNRWNYLGNFLTRPVLPWRSVIILFRWPVTIRSVDHWVGRVLTPWKYVGGVKVCFEPPKMSHSFNQNCCWISLQVSRHEVWKTCAKNWKAKLIFRAARNSFDGLTWLTLFCDRSTPLMSMLRSVGVTEEFKNSTNSSGTFCNGDEEISV